MQERFRLQTVEWQKAGMLQRAKGKGKFGIPKLVSPVKRAERKLVSVYGTFGDELTDVAFQKARASVCADFHVDTALVPFAVIDSAEVLVSFAIVGPNTNWIDMFSLDIPPK